jgi:hypothetical protein
MMLCQPCWPSRVALVPRKSGAADRRSSYLLISTLVPFAGARLVGPQRHPRAETPLPGTGPAPAFAWLSLTIFRTKAHHA